MLVTISAAARELGVSPEHVRRKIRNGEWPSYRFGIRATRIDVEEIKHLGHLIAESKRAKNVRTSLKSFLKSRHRDETGKGEGEE